MRKLLKAQTRGNLAKDWVSATFYIPRPTHKRLKAWALENDTSLQQILEEATDAWLARHGTALFYPPDWGAIPKPKRASTPD
jgi:hypothetical protein